MGADIRLKLCEGLNFLHIAALKGYLDLCKTLIDKHKFDVHMTNDGGWTALHCSALNGNYELFKFFVDKGIDILQKTKLGTNCLHIAAASGHLDLCKTLIEIHNLDVQMTDDEGLTALHYSAVSGRYKLVKFFMNKGIDILLNTDNGINCLHIAAFSEHLNLCKKLINKHNFDVHMSDNMGLTALHRSVISGNYKVFSFFASKCTDIHHLKTRTGMNCLHIAAACGHLRLCENLIDNHTFDLDVTDNNGWTSLHFCSQNGSCKLLEFFANRGANIYLKTIAGWNCLHIAAAHGHLNLCKTLIDNYTFNLDATDNNGWTSLHFSSHNGSCDLLKLFTDRGANIYLKTITELNCLHIAASNGHLNFCKILINKHSFNLHVTGDDGWTLLHMFAKNGSYEGVKFFADHGISIHLITKTGRNCLHIAASNGHLNLCKKLVKKHKLAAHVTDHLGFTALHCSAVSGSYELVKFFADEGTDIHLKTKNRPYCIPIAVLRGYFNVCATFINMSDLNMTYNEEFPAHQYFLQRSSYELLKSLVDNGTDIILNTGINCLHIAALHGHLNLCKALVNKHFFDVHLTDNDGMTALHYSASNGSYDLVKFFIDKGNDILFKTKDGMNCLHIAATIGHLNLCKALINKHYIDVNLTDNKRLTALYYSVQNGSYELVKFLAENGADIHLKTETGMNCLHIAAFRGYLSLCKYLIDKHNFDVNMTDNKGLTALHFSAINGSYELVQFFIEKEIEILFKKAFPLFSSLHAAQNITNDLINHFSNKKIVNTFERIRTSLARSQKHLFEFLRAGSSSGHDLFNFFSSKLADIYTKEISGMNCLHIAALNGNFNLCKELINKHNFDVNLTADDGLTVLHCAALNGSYELIKFFADKVDDIHVKTKSGINCLHIAALQGHLHLCKTLIHQHNFNVNVADSNGWTSLHFSAKNGSDKLVNFFVDIGTDIYLKTENGMNCLHIAAVSGHLDLCKRLIDKDNFDVHMTDNNGWTSLHFSVINGSYELVSFFIDMGTDIYLKTTDGKNCLHIASLNGHLNLCETFLGIYDFDVHITDNDGWTPLHCSANNGNFELFSYLLEKGSEIYCKTKNMENVLHLSARNGHLDICEFVLEYFVKDYHDKNTKSQHELFGKSYRSQIFYKYNTIFLHAMNVDGNTYLHLAADGNQSKVCEILLKYDIESITLLNKKDETARDIAEENDYKDVLNALKSQYDKTGMMNLYFLTPHELL